MRQSRRTSRGWRRSASPWRGGSSSATAAAASSTTIAACPTGPDSYLFTDLDAGLEIARDAGIQLVLVLLDHRWMFEGVRETIADPATGALLEVRLPDGRARVLRDQIGRESLLRGVLRAAAAPLRPQRRARRPRRDRSLPFEFMNEPDFVVEEWERDLSSRVSRPLPFAVLADLVTRVSELVHTHTQRPDDDRLCATA